MNRVKALENLADSSMLHDLSIIKCLREETTHLLAGDQRGDMDVPGQGRMEAGFSSFACVGGFTAHGQSVPLSPVIPTSALWAGRAGAVACTLQLKAFSLRGSGNFPVPALVCDAPEALEPEMSLPLRPPDRALDPPKCELP